MIGGFTQAEEHAVLSALEIARAIAESKGSIPVPVDCPLATAHTKMVVTVGMNKQIPFEAMGVPACN